MSLEVWMSFESFVFELWFSLFCYVGFISLNIRESQDNREKGRPIPTPPYHFHPPNKHLYISWVINADSSPLHIAGDWTLTGNLWFVSFIYIQTSN